MAHDSDDDDSVTELFGGFCFVKESCSELSFESRVDTIVFIVLFGLFLKLVVQIERHIKL